MSRRARALSGAEKLGAKLLRERGCFGGREHAFHVADEGGEAAAVASEDGLETGRGGDAGEGEGVAHGEAGEGGERDGAGVGEDERGDLAAERASEKPVVD